MEKKGGMSMHSCCCDDPFNFLFLCTHRATLSYSFYNRTSCEIHSHCTVACCSKVQHMPRHAM